jgi:hypothetical protein
MEVLNNLIVVPSFFSIDYFKGQTILQKNIYIFNSITRKYAYMYFFHG